MVALSMSFSLMGHRFRARRDLEVEQCCVFNIASFGDMARRGFGDGRVLMDVCRAVVQFGILASSMAGLARIVLISALKME